MVNETGGQTEIYRYVDPITPIDKRHAARFQGLIVEPLINRRLPVSFSDWDKLVLGALAFEGVCSPEGLRGFLGALGVAEQWMGRTYVSWTTDGRADRRQLSAFTVLLMRRADVGAPATDCFDIADRLAGYYTSSAVDALDKLFAGARAWQRFLPQAIASVCTGRLPWAALPASVWARRDPRYAPGPVLSQQFSVDDLGVALDAAHSGRVGRAAKRDVDDSFVAKLSSLTHGLNAEGLRLRNVEVRTQIAARLRSLADEVSQAGSVSSVIFGWVCHLLLYGTARLSDPVIPTISRYLSAVPAALHAAIVDAVNEDLEDLTDAQWASILNDAVWWCGGKKVAAAAVRTFERFLLDEGHVSKPLRLSFGRPADGLPRANVVWPHEYGKASELLLEISDLRLCQQAQTALLILRHTTLRIRELEQLRLDAVAILDSCVEVTVRRSSDLGANKSKSAARTVVITDGPTVSAVRTWVERRRTEGCERRGLLWGDPQKGDEVVYRAGSARHAISAALKAATGDPTVCIHTTRHSSISVNGEQIAAAKDDWGSVMTALAVDAGHATAAQTIENYHHLMEEPIRRHIDALLGRVEISRRAVGNWIGMSHAAVRQHASRKGWSARVDSHRFIEAHVFGPRTETTSHVASGAVSPACKVRDQIGGFDDIVAVLKARARGMTPEGISLQCSLAVTSVKKILEEAVAAAVVAGVMKREGHDEASTIPGTVFRELADGHWPTFFKMCLSEPNREVLAATCRRWLASCQSCGVDLNDSGDAVSLVSLLLDSRVVGRNWMEVRVASENGVQRVSSEALLPMLQLVAQEDQPRLVQARRGRPRGYVAIHNKPVDGKTFSNRSSLMPQLRGALTVIHCFVNAAITRAHEAGMHSPVS